VRLLHSLARTRASFDDLNLVSHAGLVPVMALAQRTGLGDLVEEHVRPDGQCGVNAQVKILCLVAGMAAGADSIHDMDLLRHGAMDALFGGIRAPSTLGSHLRCYAWGNVAQLEKAGREFLIALARQAPLLPGADTLAFIDIDSMQKRVYGHKKQGAKFGHTKIQGKSLLVRGLTAGRRPRRRADGRLLVLEVPAHLEGPAPARGKRPRRATAPAGQGRNRHPGHRARTRPAVHHRGRHQRRAARAGTAFPNAVPYLLDQRAAWRSGRSGVLRLESSPDLAAIPLKSDKRRVDHGGVAPPTRRDPRRRA
jgi:hypothetical protein